MKPDKTYKEPYLFEEMNLHTGADIFVEHALWHMLPKLPAYRKLQLGWLEELLSKFVDRIIQIADMTLLSFLECSADEIRQDDWEDIIDFFLDQSYREIEQLQQLFFQPLLMRLANDYSKWTESTPVTGKESLHAR